MRGWGWILGGVVLAAVAAMGARRFLWPVQGRITSSFGEEREAGPHNGIDIAAPVGTPILAPGAGIVSDVFVTDRGGNQLMIDTADGFRFGFAHLDDVDVSAGDAVARGQRVGTVGVTGHTTGPHLHFTMRLNDALVDPLQYLAADA